MKIKAILALLLVLCIFLPTLGQTKPATTTEPPKTDDAKDDVVRITTNLVQIDAVVTKDGKPVTDLTAQDFELYEDGRRQTITSFAYVANTANATATATVREKSGETVPFSPVKRNEQRRIMALVVDDLGLSAESMSQVRRQLRKFVAEELLPNDLVAIIRTGGDVGALQQFTNDRRVLNRTVDQLRWNLCSRAGINVIPIAGMGDHDPHNICGRRSYEQTLKSLRFILESMGELPGRKSMIVMSDSMPVDRTEERPRNESSNRDDSQDLPPGLRDSFNYSAQLDRLVERAIRSSVVIYSVDTQGLAFTGLTAADSIRGDARAITTQMQGLMSARFYMLAGRREGGEMVARETGGFQVRNTNDFKLDSILADQGGYYLLGYRPTEETFNKRFHKIKAKVKRPGMTLRTRSGFFGVTEEEANRKWSTRDLTNLALVSPFGAQDIELDMTSFFVNENLRGSAIRSFVYIDAKDLSLTAVDDRYQGAVELHGVIFGDNGSVVQQVKRLATLNLSERSYQQAMSNGIGINFDMPIKNPGAYQVRVAARDKNSSRLGSAGQFVMVPNLDSKRLAVSGIVLGTVAESTSDANQTIANPGTRSFEVNSDLYFTYMIYNAASETGNQLRSLATDLRIYRDGKAVYSTGDKPIAAQQIDLNRVLVNGVVRLAPAFEPGHYYLQVVIAEKGAKSKTAPVVQWVDFEIVSKVMNQ